MTSLFGLFYHFLRYNKLMAKEFFTITETSKMLQTTTGKVRYLINRGLIPHVRINHQKHRVLERWQVDLIEILLGMKLAGFKARDLKRYSDLVREGRHTEPERLAMLITKKRQLRQEIIRCQQAIDFIERQEDLLRQRLSKR